MKLIIDIPEDLYNWIKDEYDNSNEEVAYSAIENGIPISTEGDLISREALKKKLRLVQEAIENDENILKDVFNLIDNAPTVEPETKVVANVTFNKEQTEELVEKAKADVLAQIERPQGEWEDEIVISCAQLRRLRACIVEQKCSNCKRWSLRWFESIESEYCPHCGTKMTKEYAK